MAFTRPHSTAADATFSALGATAWDANQTPAGADVGGIPYCPTATTETTGTGLLFDGTTFSTIRGTFAAGTMTSNGNPLLVTQTRNASGVTFDGVIKAVITDTASAAGSLAMQILGGASGTHVGLQLSKSGVLSSAGMGTFSGYGLLLGANVSSPSLFKIRLTADHTALYFLNTDGTNIVLQHSTDSGTTSLLRLSSSGRYQWGATTADDAADTGVARNAAGVVEVNNGTAGTFRDIKARLFKSSGTAFASLPTAAAGDIAYITDSTVNTWGATVAGGGANKVLAWYNGTNWTVAGV